MTKYIKNEICYASKSLYYNAWGKYQALLFGAIFFFIFLFGAVYIYFAANMVMQAVGRNANIEKLSVIEREYQGLEENYLSLLSKFNLERAYSLGFIPMENASVFLSRTSRLSKNNL